MDTAITPAEIAREALRQLAVQRVAPTPDNFRQAYHRIAGEAAPPEEALAASALERHVRMLRRNAAGRDGLARRLELLHAERQWEKLGSELEATAAVLARCATLDWGRLIKELLLQWEAPRKGLTLARKREGIERLIERHRNPEEFYPRLEKLINSWTTQAADEPVPVGADAADPRPKTGPGPGAAPLPATAAPSPVPDEAVASWRGLLARTLDNVSASLVARQPTLAEDARGLAAEVGEGIGDASHPDTLETRLKRFWLNLELKSADETELQEGLLRLLRLLIDNSAQLLAEDQWVQGQMFTVAQIIAEPLSVRVIDHAERSLREAIYRQGVLRPNLTEARDALKRLMNSFIEHLGRVSEETGSYHTKISGYSDRIRKANEIDELSGILEDMLQETRQVEASTRRSRDDLNSARHQVEEAQEKIHALERELAEVSERVREDQLTGLLNRRGLEDSFQRESSRSDRHSTPLALALLDVDNFKRLNDTYGHQAGDDALKHLAKVIRRALRPSDTVGRYGGEEFVILMPDTDREAAVSVLTRLQRELTKRYFLRENQRVLITFSAGVTSRDYHEPVNAAIDRADKALYRAKKAGKNRVEPG